MQTNPMAGPRTHAVLGRDQVRITRVPRVRHHLVKENLVSKRPPNTKVSWLSLVRYMYTCTCTLNRATHNMLHKAGLR